MRKQFIISLSIFLFILFSTILIVAYGKGYRFGFDKNKVALTGTGLLVAKSVPDSAQVFVNGHLTTATDNTINLFPGEYSIRIYKEGYFPWEKKIKIQQEVVAKADALLFPTAPKLENITASGVENPIIDPSLTRLAYTVASQSALKNGAYVLDMSSRPILTLQSASSQLANDTTDIFSKSGLAWSPDGKELVATISATNTTYLLNANDFNESPTDITAILISVQNTWETEKKEKDEARLSTLKTKFKNAIKQNFNIIAWSPDETKILYQASTSATLPIIIQPRLIGADSTIEERKLQEKDVYVYDMNEDKNYKLSVDPALLGNHTSSIRWFSDSRHLVFVHDKKIDIMEYDGTNTTTIYAGPFVDNYVFPWPNGSKIVILTNLGNPTILPNLYTISLK